ncbi:MAG: DUF3301 domain-containing protein [Methylococcaceae bacterium]|nr:DUF3301 domain-containing protein [Methylococcaceae bacterium]MDD1610648.1 DUF3301 domain-containing protein [Methylococcaceae bacterium]MDD1615810.1 DUF3301 domain-containing protein [Methylococcaceae bacterium]OYV19373.1 MAG: hypothetical protein CG439_918 [Methylococcaceae bacterium NSP1-2]
MLNDLVVISLLLLAYWYWYTAQSIKAMALQATKARCAALELLMLDDYVALSRMGLKKDTAGKWQVYRCYAFEFASTGDERYNGVCTVLGNRVLSIEMQPYRIE